MPIRPTSLSVWLVTAALLLCCLRPAPAAVVIADTFSGASDGADLLLRTADSGGGYARHPSFAGSLVTTAGRIRANDGTAAHYLHTNATLPAEFDATIGFTALSATGSNAGFVFRSSNAAYSVGKTYYHVFHDGTKWVFYKVDKGWPAVLGTYRQTLTPGVEYMLTVRCRDAAKTILIDGVERMTTTDNSLVGTNRIGFRTEGAASATVGTHITGFSIDDLVPTAPPASGVTIADSFEGAAEGSDLGLRAADSGGTWARHPSFPADLLCSGGAIRAGGAPAAHYLHSYAGLSAEFDARIGFVARSAGGSNIGFVFRSANIAYSVGKTYYHVFHDGTKWVLYKVDKGWPAVLGTYRQTLTPGVEYSVLVRCRDAAKTILIDGIERITTTDNSLVGTNRIGFRTEGAATATAGTHITGLTVWDLPVATVALAAMEERRVIQRTIGGTTAPVPVSGTLTGNPARIQARAVSFDGVGQPSAWQDCVISGGTFSATLSVPQGGWYRWEAQALAGSGSPVASAAGANRWGVGIVVLCIGQSNMYGWGQTAGTSADDRVSLLRAGTTWEHLVDPWFAGGKASPGPELGNTLSRGTGLPVGLVTHAILGAGLVGPTGSVWGYRNAANPADGATVYGRALQFARRAGGCEFIAWSQGATDAAQGVSTATYLTAFHNLKGWFAQDLPDGAKIRWVHSQVGRKLDAGNLDAGYNAIREAHRQMDGGLSLLSGSTMDFAIADGVSHYDRAGQDAHGRRFGRGILHLLGLRAAAGGPRIAEAAFADAGRSVLRIRIAQRGGTDLSPAGAIPGFAIADSLGPVAITGSARVASDTIELTLASPAVGQTTMTYLAGKNPAGPTGLLRDNQADPEPVLPVTWPLVVSPPPGGNG